MKTKALVGVVVVAASVVVGWFLFGSTVTPSKQEKTSTAPIDQEGPLSEKDKPSVSVPDGWTTEVDTISGTSITMVYASAALRAPKVPEALLYITVYPASSIYVTEEGKNDLHFTKKELQVSNATGYEVEFDNTVLTFTQHHKNWYLFKEGKQYSISAGVMSDTWEFYKPTIEAFFTSVVIP